jgi:uncharacterized protein (DUF927 family)
VSKIEFVEADVCTFDNINKCKIRAELKDSTISVWCHSPLVNQWRTTEPIRFDNGALSGNIENKIISMATEFAQTERVAVTGCLYPFFEDIAKQSWYIGPSMLAGKWAGMNVPAGYTINNGNVCIEKFVSKDDKIEVPFCRVPAIVSAVGKNIDNKEYWVEILFTDIFGSVHREWVSQQDALSRRGVMKLADRGINLIEKDASVMNAYLSSCLQANQGNMQSKIVTEKTGWKCDNTLFAFGDVGYTKDKAVEIIPLQKRTSSGLLCAGDIEAWKTAALPIIKFSLLRFKMYAVVAAPLLRLLNVQSFILDHSGETSIGKTFSNDFAMSMIGNADSLRFNGDATKTAAEVLAEAYTDLPLYMDETGTQQKEEALKAIVYMLSNEQGRMRGHKDGGLRETGTWKTIAFTTGERPLTSNKSFSGQQIRVIEVQGGFTKEVINDIKIAGDVRKSNYGHIAKPYFENIFSYMDELPEMYRKARKRYITVDNVKTNRIADSFAAMLVSGMLLEDVFNDIGIEPVEPHIIVDEYFRKSLENNAIVSYSVRALQAVIDWTKSKWPSFYNEENPSDQKTNEFYGWISHDHIDVIPTELRKHLDRNGFDSTRVLNDWLEDRIITVNRGRKDYKVSRDGEQIRVVRFNRAMMNNANGV